MVKVQFHPTVIARRDVLKLRHSITTAAADAAAGRERGWSRQLRSELTFISALPVTDLRAQADDIARQIRELDTDIQRPTGRSICWKNN